jgi:WD40 repeat protein
MILTVSSDQYIRGWDLESGRFLFRFRANHSNPSILLISFNNLFLDRGETLTTACLDKNRNYMATGDSGGYIKLWDITELNQYQYGAAYVKELYMIKAHTNFINW